MTHTQESRKQLRKYIFDRPYPSVEIIHARIRNKPKGGMTTVRIWLDRGVLVEGISLCWQHESYNKRKGKSIAFGRLMRSLYLSGAKMAYLKKYKKLINSKIGIVDKKYFNAAYNGDKIE